MFVLKALPVVPFSWSPRPAPPLAGLGRIAVNGWNGVVPFACSASARMVVSLLPAARRVLARWPSPAGVSLRGVPV
jgi:hypothetical protein